MEIRGPKSNRTERVDSNDEDGNFRSASDIVVKEAASINIIQLGIF